MSAESPRHPTERQYPQSHESVEVRTVRVQPESAPDEEAPRTESPKEDVRVELAAVRERLAHSDTSPESAESIAGATDPKAIDQESEQSASAALARPESIEAASEGADARPSRAEAAINLIERLPFHANRKFVESWRAQWAKEQPATAAASAISVSEMQSEAFRERVFNRVALGGAAVGLSSMALATGEAVLGGSLAGLTGAQLVSSGMVGGLGVVAAGLVLAAVTRGGLRVWHKFQQGRHRKAYAEIFGREPQR